MPKNKITTMFLDIGGVLLSNGWDHGIRLNAATEFDLDFEEMEFRHHLNFYILEINKITLEEYLNRVVFYKDRDFTLNEFRNFMFSRSTSHDDIIAFVKELKNVYGLKIAALSNESRELNAFRINKFKLNSIFDFYISSCYVQLRKPDKDIFKMALDVAHVSVEEAVYIDNEEFFTKVATEVGIKSIWHENYLSTVNAIADMGLQIKKK